MYGIQFTFKRLTFKGPHFLKKVFALGEAARLTCSTGNKLERLACVESKPNFIRAKILAISIIGDLPRYDNPI